MLLTRLRYRRYRPWTIRQSQDVGGKVVYVGLLGEAPIMPISRFRSDGFIRLDGRIPAPIISLRN